MMSMMGGITGGTIHNKMQMAKLNMEWQQRKENSNLPKSEEESLIERMQEQIEQTEKSNTRTSIDTKLRMGKDLSNDEMEWLRKNAPDLYEEAVKIREEKKEYKRRLQRCKTKEDVSRLNAEMNQRFLAEAKAIKNNPNIPQEQKRAELDKIARRASSIQSVHMEFVASKEYQELPTEQELREEKEKKRTRVQKREIDPVEVKRIEFERKEGLPEEVKEALEARKNSLEEKAEEAMEKFSSKDGDGDKGADAAVAALKALLDTGWEPAVSEADLAGAKAFNIDNSSRGASSVNGADSLGNGSPSFGTYSARGEKVSVKVHTSTKEIKA